MIITKNGPAKISRTVAIDESIFPILSDQDIHDLAAFFASLGKATEASTTASAGADVAKTCSSCHGDSGFGLSPEMPTLAGQYESYLRESLMQYKKGKQL